jgi:hypothetical protein
MSIIYRRRCRRSIPLLMVVKCRSVVEQQHSRYRSILISRASPYIILAQLHISVTRYSILDTRQRRCALFLSVTIVFSVMMVVAGRCMIDTIG